MGVAWSSWQPELKSCGGPGASLRQSWLCQTPWSCQGQWGWPSSCPNPGLLTPFSGSVRLEKNSDHWVQAIAVLFTLQTRLHCQVQFISTVPVTVKAGSGLGWSWCWPAVLWAIPVISGSQAGPASAGNMGCRMKRDGSREGLCPSHLPRAFWCQQAMDVHLAVSYPQHWWRCGQQCTGVKYNGSCCHPAPDVIQPWDNLPRSFSSLHRVALLVPNPCRACEAQWNVAVWIQTCLDSKHSQQFLKLGGALLMGVSWVINPPLFPCLNSSSVPQKPHFKLWDRMVPVRAIPRFGFLVSQMHTGIIFSPSGSVSTVCSHWVRAYKMICCLQRWSPTK